MRILRLPSTYSSRSPSTFATLNASDRSKLEENRILFKDNRIRTLHYHTIFYPCIRIGKKQQSKQEEKNKNKNISIIKSYDFFCGNEIEISQQIVTIPNYSRYFNPVLKSSHINLAEIDDDEFENCDIIDKKTNNAPEGVQKYMCLQYLHDDNLERSESRRSSTFFSFFYNKENQRNPKKYLLHLIETYKHLLSAFQILNSKNIVYLNITPKNILINSNHNPILSDFSSSLHSLKIMEERNPRLLLLFSDYDPANYFLPVEIHIICFINNMQNESISMMNLEEVCDDYINYGLKPLNIFSSEFIDRYKTSVLFSLKPIINKSKEDIIRLLIQQYWISWDNYGLSIMYLSLITNIFKKNRGSEVLAEEVVNNKFIIEFSALLLNNILSNNRNTIQKSASAFNELLYNVGYKELIEMVSFLVSKNDPFIF